MFVVVGVVLLRIVGAAAELVVDIPGLGLVHGTTGSETVELFLGIPFAAAPVGDLRWRAPEPHPGWSGPLLATQFAPSCLQDPFVDVGDTSEDCLYLNVARPAKGGRRLPVMFWIHGGGNTEGTTHDANSNITTLVGSSAESVIGVSTAYRLNVFGWLGSRALQADAADGSAGNYGLEDQRYAMLWVHAHIEAFGGDAARVTIFGESAGAFDVAFHLTQPSSYHLYSQAIMESYGNNEIVSDVFSLDHAEDAYRQLLNSTNCDDLVCMRGLTANTFRAAFADKWAPVADGVTTLAPPATLFASGDFNKIPVIIGSNREEMSIVTHGNPVVPIPSLPPNMTEEQLDGIFPSLFIPREPLTSKEIAQVKRLYSPEVYEYPEQRGPFNQNWWTATRILTDVESTGFCTTRRFARGLAALTKVFAYHFEHPPQYTTDEPLWSWFGPGNVCVPHGSELRYVFNGLPDTASVADRDVARRVAATWISFAATADPSAKPDALQAWREFGNTGSVMRIQTTGQHMQNDLREKACDFWDGIWGQTRASGAEVFV